MHAPVLSFDLPLATLAPAVCKDTATASVAYAEALKVDKGAADAKLALMVDRIPTMGADAQEPAALALEEEGLFLLHQRLLVELYALGWRELPWQQKRALLRAMQIMGVSSLAELGEMGNVAAIVDAVG